jgi:DnaJ-class molecular chaperone
MPRLRESNRSGDLYARLKVEIPRNLNKRERELFEELASKKRR